MSGGDEAVSGRVWQHFWQFVARVLHGWHVPVQESPRGWLGTLQQQIQAPCGIFTQGDCANWIVMQTGNGITGITSERPICCLQSWRFLAIKLRRNPSVPRVCSYSNNGSFFKRMGGSRKTRLTGLEVSYVSCTEPATL